MLRENKATDQNKKDWKLERVVIINEKMADQQVK